MTKKKYGEIVRGSALKEQKAARDRFASADGVILMSTASAGGSGQNLPSATNPAPSRPLAQRTGFSMTEEEFELIESMRSSLLKTGRDTTKSEVIRAGLHVLKMLDHAALTEAVNDLEILKPGPKS